MKTRKQVYELTRADLKKFPVWEFALDEEGEPDQDEATVRPYSVKGPLDPSDGMFVVRARFVLADGTEHIGYLTPGHAATDLGSIQPQIITNKGQVIFWMGSIKNDIQPLYALLKKTASEVFPIAFSSDVNLVDGLVTGEIPAFLHLIDWKSGRVDLIK